MALKHLDHAQKGDVIVFMTEVTLRYGFSSIIWLKILIFVPEQRWIRLTSLKHLLHQEK